MRLQGGEVLLFPKILVRPKPIWKFQKISNSSVGGSLWKSLVESSDVSLRAKTRRSNWKLPRLQRTENFKSVKNSPGAAALDAVSWRLTYSSGCDRLTTTWMTSWFEVQSFPTTCKFGQWGVHSLLIGLLLDPYIDGCTGDNCDHGDNDDNDDDEKMTLMMKKNLCAKQNCSRDCSI